METFEYRRKFYIVLFIFATAILIIRLFHIQVLDRSFRITADNNSIRKVVQYPARGLIYDRNNKLLVYNKASHNVIVIPGLVKEFDSTEFCKILNISKDFLKNGITRARQYSRYKPSVFLKRISSDNFATLSEKLFKFPGFSITTIPVREYPENTASHLLGYLGEVGEAEMVKDRYYEIGDYVGISGIEKVYEKDIRGNKGSAFFLVDVHNRVVNSYLNGRFDTLAVKGKDIITGVDINLQKYGESLLENKTGSIVALEPSTGEILCMVSSPFYDPDIFVGRERGKNFEKLLTDSLNPLFNRATMSRYAPGSIFKIVQALIALDMGVISWETSFTCDKSLMGCHDHPIADNMSKAIQYSCNPYFYEVYKAIIQQGYDNNIFRDSRLGTEIWSNYVARFGLGKVLDIDLTEENPGLIPDAGFYDEWYGIGSWAFSTIYSNCNGQGEIETTPLQIANLAAIIANEGYYFKPHIVRGFVGENTRRFNTDTIFTQINEKYFGLIKEAMYNVVWGVSGTGYNARIPGIEVSGKTGTVENFYGPNHSGFFAIAPVENSKIVISVYVENAGEGGGLAARIASLMIEKYLNGFVTQKLKENEVLEFQNELN